jgi:hypothetical protein
MITSSGSDRNSRSAAPPLKENIMAANTKRHSRDRTRSETVIKVAALLGGLAALGLVALGLVERAPPLLHASAGYALEAQMFNTEATAMTSDFASWRGPNATDVQAGTILAPPARHYEYLPDHFVNKATKIDEQPPTF